MIVRSNDKYTDALFDALLKLKTKEEISAVFEDLCTMNEIHAMGQRLEVARLLSENIPYNEIADITGASTATISRVAKALNYGAGGYKLVLGED
ncbi:MAG: TrpR-like protein YerC/YecD [Clostridia bacterium]|nr:TrpR-like protein YerC/YecD [Clostridia bacterium]